MNKIKVTTVSSVATSSLRRVRVLLFTARFVCSKGKREITGCKSGDRRTPRGGVPTRRFGSGHGERAIVSRSLSEGWSSRAIRGEWLCKQTVRASAAILILTERAL